MTAFHAQKEFQDRTVSIGNDEKYFVSGCLLLLDCTARRNGGAASRTRPRS